MTDVKSIFHIACADLDSLLTEDLWCSISNIIFSPEYIGVKYILPSTGTASLQSTILLGYADKEPVEFVFGERNTTAKPRIEIDGVRVSSTHALQSLFSMRGMPAADFPHGILIRIIEDTQQRISAAYRFSIDTHLLQKEKEIDAFRFVLGYEMYMKNLKGRYNSAEFVSFAPKTLLGHLWRRFQVQML